MGALSRPAFPPLPGIERFRGTAFHSAQWRHDHTLRGRRVAVIGTGASAIQFVPQIAPEVEQLDVYQRSAPWIIAKADRPLPGWERALFRRWPALQRLLRLWVYWRLESRLLGFVHSPKLMRLAARKALKHLQRQVADPALRARLTPDYAFGCKRILISDDFYPALNRPNVALISEAIREVREHSIVTADGQERAIDTLIFGTGFQAQVPVPRGMIFGLGGVELNDCWPQGPEAFLGLSVAGFPNLFFMIGPNTGLAHNSMVYMIEAQARYVIDSLRSMQRAAWSRIEVQAEVQRSFNEGLQAKISQTVWGSGCRSWYLNDQGRNTLLWPGATFSYRRLTRRFEAQHYLCRSHRETVT
jgi:cyclohexanone monooxygenase